MAAGIETGVYFFAQAITVEEAIARSNDKENNFSNQITEEASKGFFKKKKSSLVDIIDEKPKKVKNQILNRRIK